MNAFWRFAAIALLVFASLLVVGLFLKNRHAPAEPPQPPVPIRFFPIAPPGKFPKDHLGYLLQAQQEEKPPQGVKSHHAAIYWSAEDPETEISVRLLTLDQDNARPFLEAILREIRKTGHELPNPGMPENSGWESARLMESKGAGIYIAWAGSVILVVSGGNPALALEFGSSLLLEGNTPSSARH